MLDETDYKWLAEMYEKTMKAYQSENAKLRELIGILAFCANDEAHDCDKCAINGAEMHVTVPEWLFCDSLIERLRTLGVEVSE